MRRKSERAKKAKESPEKPEKPKKSRSSRRRKASSSEAESEDEHSSQVPDVAGNEQSEEHGTESQSDDKVWQVKSDDSSSGTGEIKKLKICLSTRTPITPEPEATPRSRRKLNRTISETPSETTRHSRHKVRRSTRESRDSTAPEIHSEDDYSSNKEQAIQEQAEPLMIEVDKPATESTHCVVQSDSAIVNLSTSNELKIDSSTKETEEVKSPDDIKEKGPEVAPSTPVAKCRRSRRLSGSSPQRELSPEKSQSVKLPLITEEVEQKQAEVQYSEVGEDLPSNHKHNEENTCADNGEKVNNFNESEQQQTINEKQGQEVKDTLENEKVDISLKSDQNEDKNTSEKSSESEIAQSKKSKSPDNSRSPEKSPEKNILSEINQSESTFKESCPTVYSSTAEESLKEFSDADEVFKANHSRQNRHSSERETCDSISNNILDNHSKETEDNHEDVSKSNQEPVETFNATPIVVSRKRKWGTRAKTNEKPVSISTDILKDIIPDVKPTELEEVIEDKKQRRKSANLDKPIMDRPMLPKIVIDNSENAHLNRREREKEYKDKKETPLTEHRKISIVKEDNYVARPPSPARHKTSSVLYITNLVRPFTLAQLKNLLQRTGKIVTEGFWIDRIKSKCFVTYENEDQAIETRHALHGVTWPVSNPKTLQVDFSSTEALERMRAAEEQGQEKVSTLPGTVEDWMREQDAKKDRFAEMDAKPRDKRNIVREWDVGKNEKEKERLRKDERAPERHRNRADERSPEPARKLKRKEEEPPAKMLDDLFRKTKTVPCIYWLPLSAETIAIKEEQRRQHMAEHERRMQELERTRTHRRH